MKKISFRLLLSVFIRVHLWLSLLFVSGFAFAAGIKILEDVPSTFVYPADGFIPWNIHRATPTLLTLMMPGASFNDPQGMACVLLNSDKDPKDPKNDVLVTAVGVNGGAGELIYNVGLKDIRRFGSSGSGERQFLSPTGVAIHPNGDVAVADTGNQRVVLLKHDGLRLKWVQAVGKKGTGLGEFNGPTGVAFDSKENLYIADTGNNRIQVRDKTGKFRLLRTPALRGPSALAVIDAGESWTFYQQGPHANRLAVIDQEGTRLQTLTLEGTALAQVSAAQIPEPPVKLWGCSFDYYGNLVATDFAKSCLRKFDKNLKYLVTFGGAGTGDFQFTEPRGIAIHRQLGQVIVSEKKSAQYFWSGADAVKLEVLPEGANRRFRFFLTERAVVSAEVESQGGVTLKKLVENQDLEEGLQEFTWAPDSSVKSGDFYLKLKVMATYSSRDRIAKAISLRFAYTK